MILPTLYKPTRTGNTQQCVIEAYNGIVTVTFGLINGIQQRKSTKCFPKNVGRSNETTAQEQAELEAHSKFEKKLKEGYATSIQESSTVNLPMKVHTYQDHKHKIKFPCFVSPKLNGVNAEYRLLPEPHVVSRGGEIYPTVQHRDNHVFNEMRKHNIDSVNGELYLHGSHLQDIQSAVTKPSQDKLQPIFFAFDLPTFDGIYTIRIDKLAKMKIQRIPVTIANSHDEILELHEKFKSHGYEGTIIRNADGLYEYNTRSYDVLKLKDAQDAEFKIINHNVDKNGHPVFICEVNDEITDNDTRKLPTFKVKPKGTDAERKAILANINDYIGHWYKIEFETYSKDGIPLKPVGIGLRKCDNNGNPLQ